MKYELFALLNFAAGVYRAEKTRRSGFLIGRVAGGIDNLGGGGNVGCVSLQVNRLLSRVEIKFYILM